MPLTHNEQSITDQLVSAIKNMRNFLLDLENFNAINFDNKKIYEEHYAGIEKLSIKVRAEGYEGYKHKNSHKTLAEFLNSGKISKQIIKYYSRPKFEKDIISKNRILKMIDGAIKRVGKVTEVIGKTIK